MAKPSAALMSGVPELLVLQMLAGREMYGYEIARSIRTVTRDAVSVGESVLYPALHTLEVRGLVKTRRLTVEGRERVYYTITAKGRRRLQGLTADWHRIAAGVKAVLGGVSNA